MKRWHVSDLVTHEATGRLSETKLWSNIGKAAMTFGFVWVVVHGSSSEFLWATYGGVVVLHAMGNRFMDGKKSAEEHAKTSG